MMFVKFHVTISKCFFFFINRVICIELFPERLLSEKSKKLHLTISKANQGIR